MSEILVRDVDQLLSIVSADELKTVAYNEARRRERDYSLTDEEIAVGGFCPYATPPITGLLRGLGVLAARTEYHELGASCHYLTSVPLQGGHEEDDLVVCSTWRQFVHPERPAGYHDVFMGPRAEITQVVRKYAPPRSEWERLFQGNTLVSSL